MIEHFQQQFHSNIGFVPRGAQQQRLENHDYWKISTNGQSCGFVLVGGGTRQPIRLSQIAIAEDLWRNGIGRSVITAAKNYALQFRKPQIVATIADSLAMNEVAAATAAIHTATTIRKSLRKRRCNHWLWTDHTQPIHPTAAATAAIHGANIDFH